MQLPLCRHIKTNGLQCESPSLTGALYCFFHQRLYARHSPYRYNPATRSSYLISGQHVQLEPLEDAESVQVALSVIINALATGQLETRRATALLYGLSLASVNVRRLACVPSASKVVRNVGQTPEGLDLAQPGATYEPFEYDDEDEEYEDDNLEEDS